MKIRAHNCLRSERRLVLAILLSCLPFVANCMSNDVVDILSKTPGWSTIGPEDGESRQKLLSLLSSLDTVRTNDIRAGVVEYLETLKGASSLNDLSKIFILNRLLFRVPVDENRNRARFFGGWRGVPFVGDKVNMMWPVATDSQGRLIISGIFSGYSGEDYWALSEFDHFTTTYGRRNREVDLRIPADAGH